MFRCNDAIVPVLSLMQAISLSDVDRAVCALCYPSRHTNTELERRHMSIVGIHYPQPVVVRIADDERAAGCEGHTTRFIETTSFPGLSAIRKTSFVTVDAIIRKAGAGNRGHDAIGR